MATNSSQVDFIAFYYAVHTRSRPIYELRSMVTCHGLGLRSGLGKKPQHISELNSTIDLFRLKNAIAPFSSEMCWGVSKSASHPQTMMCPSHPSTHEYHIPPQYAHPVLATGRRGTYTACSEVTWCTIIVRL